MSLAVFVQRSVLGLAVGVMAVPVSAVASQPERAVAEGQVTVDATTIGTMPAETVADVQRRSTKAAIDAGIDPATVTLSMVEVDPVEVIRGVRLRVDGEDEPGLSDPEDPRGPLLAECTACSDQELGDLAVEATITAVRKLAKEREEQRAAAAREAEASESEPELEPVDPNPAPVDTPRRGLGGLGWAGVAAMGVGLGSTVAGAVLASRSPAPFPGEMRKDELRDLRPPGYAMLGAGGALLITGAVLLIIDRRRSKQSTVAWAPSTTPALWGMTITGRF